MKKLTPTIIGEIGEFVAQQYLNQNGYELVQFGKAMYRSKKKQPFKTCNLPIVPDFGIGYAYGDFRYASNSLEIQTEWIDSHYPAWSDFEYKDIQLLAKECRECSVCEMREKKPSSAPCFKVDRILDKDWLSSITPYNSEFTLYDSKSKEIKLKGHKLVYQCLEKFTQIVLDKNRSTVPYGENFLLINMIVSDYIERCWWKHLDKINKIKAPHDEGEIKLVEKKYGRHEADKLRNENQKSTMKLHKEFPGYGFHPGRYDFIGHKDGELFAIEVKVNSSNTNYWQIVRLALLKRFGCNIMTLRIIMSQEHLQNAFKGEDSEFESITIDDDIDTSTVDLPTESEFLETLNYVADHEKI